jgi:hypothetical protein
MKGKRKLQHAFIIQVDQLCKVIKIRAFYLSIFPLTSSQKGSTKRKLFPYLDIEIGDQDQCAVLFKEFIHKDEFLNLLEGEEGRRGGGGEEGEEEGRRGGGDITNKTTNTNLTKNNTKPQATNYKLQTKL